MSLLTSPYDPLASSFPTTIHQRFDSIGSSPGFFAMQPLTPLPPGLAKAGMLRTDSVPVPTHKTNIVPVVPLAPEPATKSIIKLSKEAEDDDVTSDYHGPPIGYSIKAVYHNSVTGGLRSITTHGNVQAPRPVFIAICDTPGCTVCKSHATLHPGAAMFTPTIKQEKHNVWDEQEDLASLRYPVTPAKPLRHKVSEENGLEVYGGCEEVVSVKRSPPMINVASLEKDL